MLFFNLKKPTQSQVSTRYFLPLMVVILVIAFGLRVINLTTTDFDIDEGWTYVNFTYLQSPESISHAVREPNNLLHILLTSALLNVVPWQLGARLLSVMAGVMCVAVTARIGTRVFNKRPALLAAVISTIAFNAIDISQTARPYIFANLFGLLALWMWLERRYYWNILASTFVPLFHVGGMPLVILPDVYTVIGILRGKQVNWLHWIMSRLPPYIILFAILILTYLRRISGKVISAGQSPPSLQAIIVDAISSIQGEINFSMPEACHVVFLICVVIVLGYVLRQVSQYKYLTIPVLWLILSYGTVSIMAIVSDGPLKLLHITHITYAVALLIGFGLSQMPRRLCLIMLALILVINMVSLSRFYTQPFQSYQETYLALQEWYSEEKHGVVYYQSLSPMDSLAFNIRADLSRIFQYLPDNPPDEYYYIQFRQYDPPLSSACDENAIWQYWDFHIHYCVHENR